jgi:hypothetical protein
MQTRCCQRMVELRAIGAFAALHFSKLCNNLPSITIELGRDSLALRIEAEAALALAIRRDRVISDDFTAGSHFGSSVHSHIRRGRRVKMSNTAHYDIGETRIAGRLAARHRRDSQMMSMQQAPGRHFGMSNGSSYAKCTWPITSPGARLIQYTASHTTTNLCVPNVQR